MNTVDQEKEGSPKERDAGLRIGNMEWGLVLGPGFRNRL